MFLLTLFTLCYSWLEEESEGVWKLDKSNFQEALKSQNGLLVEFYAKWCGHCSQFSPVYAEIGKILKGKKIQVAKIEEKGNEEILKLYGVKSFPSLIYFVNWIDIVYDGGRSLEEVINWVYARKQNPYKILEALDDVQELTNQKFWVLYVGSINHNARKVFDQAYLSVKDIEFGIYDSKNLLEEFNYESPFIILSCNKVRHQYNLTDSVSDLISFLELNKPPRIYVWNQETVSLIVKHHTSALIFLLNEEEKTSHNTTIMQLSEKFHSKLLITMTDIEHEEDFQQFLGLSSEDQPLALIIEYKKIFHKYKCDDISFEGVSKFVEGWENRTLMPYLKSEKIPKKEIEKRIKVLVGKNFKEVVNDNTKDVVVLFYRTVESAVDILKIYERVAYELKNWKDLVLCKVNIDNNDIEDLRLKGDPAIKIYPKEKKDGFDYSSYASKFALIEFIQSYRS